MKKLSEQLKKEATSMSVCSTFMSEWDNMGLVEKYYEGAEWCMEREYPSYEILDKYDKEMVAYGVYNRKKIDIIADKEKYVFNGSEATLTVEDYKVCRVFVGRNTKLHVIAKRNAIVIVTRFTGSEVTRETSGGAKCIIWDKELEI